MLIRSFLIYHYLANLGIDFFRKKITKKNYIFLKESSCNIDDKGGSHLQKIMSFVLSLLGV